MAVNGQLLGVEVVGQHGRIRRRQITQEAVRGQVGSSDDVGAKLSQRVAIREEAAVQVLQC